MSEQSDLHKVQITLPCALCDDAQAATLSAHVFSEALSSTSFKDKKTERFILEGYYDSPPDQITLKTHLIAAGSLLDLPEAFSVQCTWSTEIVDMSVNWLEQCYQEFPAFTVGPFFIYGSHHQDTPPDDKLTLQIDATTAFGSGEHGTTKGCLMALHDLNEQGVCPWQVLDMGTGSGILALASWKLWKTPVIAIDNDPEATAVTLRHAQTNYVPTSSGNLQAETGDGFKADLCQKKAPYELIIANILAAPLMTMRDEMIAVLDDNGYVVLSGILAEQADEVSAHYTQTGALKDVKRYPIDEWVSIMLQKI